MARPERPVDPSAGPLQRFAHELRRLRVLAGSPSYQALARQTNYSVATLSEAARGLRRPSLKVTIAYVRGCGGDPEDWARRWHRLTEELERDDRRPAEPGRGAGVDADPGRLAREHEELLELRREVSELRSANETLKRASAIFAADLNRIRSAVDGDRRR